HLFEKSVKAGVVEGGLKRWVELGAVAKACVAFAELRSHSLPGPSHRDVVQRFVADQVGHALPVAGEAPGVELRHQMVEAVNGEHGLIGPGGGVERDLLLHRLPIPRDLVWRVSQYYHGGRAEDEVLAGPPRGA